MNPYEPPAEPPWEPDPPEMSPEPKRLSLWKVFWAFALLLITVLLIAWLLLPTG